MLKIFLGKTIRALQTILVLVISFSFLGIESAFKPDFQKSVRKRIFIQGQLNIFLHKISLRSVENYFT